MKRRVERAVLALCFGLALAGCSAKRIFYYPNARLYADPHNAGLEYELVRYPSLDGTELTGLYFRTDREPLGTIVHFHGNFGNVSNHFPQSVFLTRHGFDVLIFDYRGFGGSAGRPSPEGTVADGVASVRYARSRLRSPEGRVGVFGQSLGAAVAAVTAAREPFVRAAVLEAGFTAYRAITKDVMKRSWLTWPFSHFVPALIVRRRWDPVDYVADISPRPVFLIHGTADRTVPAWMSRKLYEKAREPKTLWMVEGAEHLGCRKAAGPQYEEEVARFFREAFSSPLTGKN